MSLQKIIAVVGRLLLRLWPRARNRSPLINLPTSPEDGPSNKIPPGQPPPDGFLADADNITGDSRDAPTKTEPEPLTPNELEKSPSDSPENTSGKSGTSSIQPSEDVLDASPDNPDVNNTSPQGSSEPPSDSTQGGEPQANSDSDTSCDFNKGNKEQTGKNPREIGSRRTSGPSRRGSIPQRSPTSRPELICRKPPGSLQWEVTLSVDDECGVRAVHRDGEPLEVMNREYRLSSLTGRLTIAFEDGKNDEFTLFEDKPLIFKLRNNWTGEGRKTDGITKGFFVIIAPNKWERTGHVPVEPDGCSDKDFTAHYFYRDGTAPMKNTGGFRQYEVATTASAFELIGECVFDDSDFGDIFVGAVPTLKLASNIAWVRVGEERVNGWKGNNFRPGVGCLSDILNRRQGRFFIRVYDSQVKLIDSGEFRYLRDLKEIRVNNERYTEYALLVPPATGHPPTTVRFVGIDGRAIQPILPFDLPFELTHSKEQECDFVVEPRPSRDHISFAVKSDMGSVDIVLNLPRIWWRMAHDGSESGEWQDTPLTVTRKEFRRHAYANATIRLRYPRRITSVRAGLDDELDRVYLRKYRENDCVIPLADFADYSQIDQPLSQDASFTVESGGVKLTLIQVSCDPVPAITSFTREPATIAVGEQATLLWATRNGEAGGVTMAPEIGPVALNGSLDVAPSETTTYTLRLTALGKDAVTKSVTVTVRASHHADKKPTAWVIRTGGSWKRGKGFSEGEILATGLTVAGATQRSLPYDKRRRSTHQANIERIRRWTDA